MAPLSLFTLSKLTAKRSSDQDALDEILDLYPGAKAGALNEVNNMLQATDEIVESCVEPMS